MELLIIQHNHITLHACILLGLGLIIRYWIGRRRFNRRGIAGLQLFTSYEKWWLVTRIESLINLLALVAIVAGLFLLIFK
jgi:hypothetical protein